MNRSYYSKSIAAFLADDSALIVGELVTHHTFALEDQQKNAWMRQIEILKNTFRDHPEGYIFFEFAIPRMGKRVDNIIIIDDLIYVVEFKVGDEKFHRYASDQVVDYCLDLINFHEGSHNAKLIPVLVATKAGHVVNKLEKSIEQLYSTQLTNGEDLYEALHACFGEMGSVAIDPTEWEKTLYKPTPTIIEAAQALYKGHDVHEISRSDAGKINLSKTAHCINEIIEYSKTNNRKAICFVTGVPGAGKTLAGLNIANERQKAAEDEHAVFLSGNGPLVDVMREALARDDVSHTKELGGKIKKDNAKRKANSFIQNIHHFRDNYLNEDVLPTEKVVIFDEAQRAWTKKKASDFMKRKKGRENFDQSEPDFLIGVMNRHPGWCAVICLIGGGQEIYDGEAGLEEWIQAIKAHYGNWDVYFSSAVVSRADYVRDPEVRGWLEGNGQKKSDLHLAVSARSFRSEKVSDFVHALLELEIVKARDLYNEISSKYPIVLTRDLETAKEWLRKKARGTERIGMVAASGERRLRAIGIDSKNDIDASNWFLNDKSDVRSSYFLEDIATEFSIQGLEIDWVCLAWGASFHFDGRKWVYQAFKGSKWSNIKSETVQRYLKNTYRVLLTRARQGMVIYLPHGSEIDHTRPNHFYDKTFELFKKVDIIEI
jgi:hypothetical protein